MAFQMDELISIINSFQKLDSITEDAVRKYFVIETFKKNELIVKHDKICKKMYFIKSGVVRRFSLQDEAERTNWIYTNSQFFTSLSSFFEQKASFENFEASEETIVYSISYEDELVLLEYPLFSRFHIKQLRLYLSKLNEFHHTFRFMTAQEKYSFLLANFPEMIKKAKLMHIASLIGVSQETLSRIRASII